MNDSRQVHELEHESPGKLIRKYFFPAFASMLANALYNVVDRIYIGQGVDALALSGLTVVFPLMIIIMAFGMLVGAGAGVRIFLPMFGLLGLDWGYGFDKIIGMPSANKGQFHFSMNSSID